MNAEQFRNIRQKTGMTQRDFAEFAGIPMGSIEAIENGRLPVTSWAYEKITQAKAHKPTPAVSMKERAHEIIMDTQIQQALEVPERAPRIRITGKALIEFREKYDLSRPAAAILSGTSEHGWRHWEKEDSSPKKDNKQKLRAMFAKSHEELLSEAILAREIMRGEAKGRTGTPGRFRPGRTVAPDRDLDLCEESNLVESGQYRVPDRFQPSRHQPGPGYARRLMYITGVDTDTLRHTIGVEDAERWNMLLNYAAPWSDAERATLKEVGKWVSDQGDGKRFPKHMIPKKDHDTESSEESSEESSLDDAVKKLIASAQMYNRSRDLAGAQSRHDTIRLAVVATAAAAAGAALVKWGSLLL